MPAGGVLSRHFEYPASGRVRTGTLYSARDTGGQGKDALVVVHGLFAWRDLPEIALVCEELAAGFDVVSIDLRGHGDAPGAFTWGRVESGELAELISFLHHMHRAVGVLGFSMGGYIGILAAAQARRRDDCARPEALCTVGAPASLQFWRLGFRPGACRRHLKLILSRKRRLVRLAWPWHGNPAAVDLIPEVAPIPLLIIHGGNDWLVHPDQARRLYEAAGEPRRLKVIEEGLHAEYIIAQDPGLLVPEVNRFFTETLGRTADLYAGPRIPEISPEITLGRGRS